MLTNIRVKSDIADTVPADIANGGANSSIRSGSSIISSGNSSDVNSISGGGGGGVIIKEEKAVSALPANRCGVAIKVEPGLSTSNNSAQFSSSSSNGQKHQQQQQQQQPKSKADSQGLYLLGPVTRKLVITPGLYKTILIPCTKLY